MQVIHTEDKNNGEKWLTKKVVLKISPVNIL